MNYIYRASVTMPTPVSIPVPRVGLAEVQPVPAPTLVPRVGTAGVRPVPASIPVPWREATKLQPQSPVQSSLYQLGFQESLTSHHLFLLGALVSPSTHEQLPRHCQLQLHHLHLLSDKTYRDVWKLIKTIEVSSCAYDNGRC